MTTSDTRLEFSDCNSPGGPCHHPGTYGRPEPAPEAGRPDREAQAHLNLPCEAVALPHVQVIISEGQ